MNIDLGRGFLKTSRGHISCQFSSQSEFKLFQRINIGRGGYDVCGWGKLHAVPGGTQIELKYKIVNGFVGLTFAYIWLLFVTAMGVHAFISLKQSASDGAAAIALTFYLAFASFGISARIEYGRQIEKLHQRLLDAVV